MNILVTGANGQLGTHFRLLAPKSEHTWFFTDVAELDITSREAVRSFVADHGIQLIVNCAAYTNVDRAESDEATALRINAEAVGYLAEASTFIEVIEKRQGLKVACLESIGYEQGWLSADDVRRVAQPMIKNQYGQYLVKLVDNERD